ERTVRDVLEAMAVENPELKTTQWVEKLIDNKYREFKSNYINLSIKETLPPEWQSKVEGKIPEVSTYILNKGIDYFSSVEGKQRVRRMIDDFLAEWGKLGNMLQMVLGNTSLADKVQPEIIKFLRNEGTKDLIDSVLMKEWEKILDWKWEYVFEQLSDEKVVEKGKAFLINQLNISAIYSKPVSQVLEPFGEKIIHGVIPKAVDRGGRFIATRIPAIMGKLRIGDIVRQQVEEFSLERLEQMVLEISYKELKMITYLGALLGGVIGLIQGGIVTLFQ
ncbi:MAG TPA: DUF445 family protein, partial [Chondromyces sp.]|nr:DUF445 family protein [Chondromyces sp.]